MVKLSQLNFHLIVYYKQPRVDSKLFTRELECFLENKTKYIMIGDSNINLLKNNTITKSFIDVLLANACVLLNCVDLKHNTREADRTLANGQIRKSKTVIDHIFTDITKFSFAMSLNGTSISDHKTILVGFNDENNNTHTQQNKATTVTYMSINERIYGNELISSDAQLEGATTLDELVGKLDIIRTKSIEKKECKEKSNNRKPWITTELLDLIKERERYYKLKKKTPSNTYIKNTYNLICRKTKMLRAKLRMNFNSNKINAAMSNPKKMWSTINEILYNKNKITDPIGSMLKFDGTVTSNKMEIADILNYYFCNIGKELFDKITNNDTNGQRTHITSLSSSIALRAVTNDEITNYIKKMKRKTDTFDCISSNLLKTHAEFIAPIITKIINEHYETGTFPDALKISRIIPIFKSGNPNLPENYRPISILPALSKIFETTLYHRLTNFFEKHNLIAKNQFGFQPKSGTLSAASTLINRIQMKLDEDTKRVVCCVFIDLKKAFDTVPHELLLGKLMNYGIRGNANKIIQQYLKNRKQFVHLSNTCSDKIINNNAFSIPQGCNLGPFCFIVYINDIFELRLNGTLILFADDAILTYEHTDMIHLQNKIQEDINTITKWLHRNRLTPNAEKTKFMLIKTPKNKQQQHDFKLQMNGTEIQGVTTFKYLGLTLHHNLGWLDHIDGIRKKILALAGVTKRLGSRMSKSTKISFYYSMIQSHLSYLSPIWGNSAGIVELKKLQVAQNISIRRIFYREYIMEKLSTEQIRKKYKIPNVKQIIDINSALLTYKIDNRLIKTDLHINRNRTHNYQTRQRHTPIIHTYNTQMGKTNMLRTCTILYNSLSNEVRNTHSIGIFKKRTKDFFLS